MPMAAAAIQKWCRSVGMVCAVLLGPGMNWLTGLCRMLVIKQNVYFAINAAIQGGCSLTTGVNLCTQRNRMDALFFSQR